MFMFYVYIFVYVYVYVYVLCLYFCLKNKNALKSSAMLADSQCPNELCARKMVPRLSTGGDASSHR